jgi:hypothetical protein
MKKVTTLSVYQFLKRIPDEKGNYTAVVAKERRTQ